MFTRAMRLSILVFGLFLISDAQRSAAVVQPAEASAATEPTALTIE